MDLCVHRRAVHKRQRVAARPPSVRQARLPTSPGQTHADSGHPRRAARTSQPHPRRRAQRGSDAGVAVSSGGAGVFHVTQLSDLAIPGNTVVFVRAGQCEFVVDDGTGRARIPGGGRARASSASEPLAGGIDRDAPMSLVSSAGAFGLAVPKRWCDSVGESLSCLKATNPRLGLSGDRAGDRAGAPTRATFATSRSAWRSSRPISRARSSCSRPCRSSEIQLI